MSADIGIVRRKISKTGDSLHVSLPSEWVKEQQLRAKDEIRVVFDNLLLVIPQSIKLEDENLIEELTNLIKAGAIHERVKKHGENINERQRHTPAMRGEVSHEK